MPKMNLFAILLTLMVVSSLYQGQIPALAAEQFTLVAGDLIITMNNSGEVTSLKNNIDQTEYIQSSYIKPLIKLVVDNEEQLPSSVTFNGTTSTYTFDFSSKDIQVDIKSISKANYMTLEVTNLVTPIGVDVEVLMWGPITTSIKDQVGETVGIAQNDEFAIGIHSLNTKTIGGWPIEFQSLGLYSESIGPNRMPYNTNAACRTSWGSFLQAYTYDYTKVRTRTLGILGLPSQYHESQIPIMSGDDASIVGSKIAIFGQDVSSVFDTLSSIEVSEGLPHPTIDGEWQKTAQKTKKSFHVFLDLNSSNVATAAQIANASGLDTIYSLDGAGGPWSQGHYIFKSSFGGSDEGAAAMVDTAATYNVNMGVHTLSGFIDTNDSYVEPIPHSGLAEVDSTKLTRDISSTATTIYVENNHPFTTAAGKKAQIGNELITYSSISQISANEWSLNGVSRGQYGTSSASHITGDAIIRLWESQYGSFVAGHDLLDEISDRLATAFNNTGIRAMSFDGLEALYESEYGMYDMAEFKNNVFNSLDNQDGFICEASTMAHNIWNAQSRVSWGESYTGMQAVYNNMEYMERNYLPPMMGWIYFSNLPEVKDVEWVLSKMASWNAGAGFQSRISERAGYAAKYEAIKQWETARNLGAFTDYQRAIMKPIDTYWTLSVITEGSKWSLQEINSLGIPIGDPQEVFVGNTAVGPLNVASGKSITISGSGAQNASFVTDGDVNSDNWYGINESGRQWFQIDLGERYNINLINIWRYYKDGRTYSDCLIQLSNDPNFRTGVKTVFNNDVDNSDRMGFGTDAEYVETSDGKEISFDTINTRYVRLYSSGNTTNEFNHLVEVAVYENGVKTPINLASEKTTTISGSGVQNASFVTDGDVNSENWYGIDESGLQWFQIDLAQSFDINQIDIWRYYTDGRTYSDCVIQVSNDSSFNTGVKTVYNNDIDNSAGLGVGTDVEYAETSDGKEINFSTTNARYVRLYSSGNTTNDFNHLVEVEVYGD